MYTFVDLQCVNKQIWQAMYNEVLGRPRYSRYGNELFHNVALFKFY